jgi:hypothetical protein
MAKEGCSMNSGIPGYLTIGLVAVAIGIGPGNALAQSTPGTSRRRLGKSRLPFVRWHEPDKSRDLRPVL